MKRISLLVIVAALLARPDTAFASTIVFFHSDRFVQAGDESLFREDFGPWSALLNGTGGAIASQTSDISTSFIGGTGLATGADSGLSSLYTMFELSQQFTADIAVQILAENAFALASMSGPTSGARFQLLTQNGTEAVTLSTVLLPGRYEFLMFVSSNQVGAPVSGASFNGGLTLTPIAGTEVPEPATLTLFGLGLLGVASRYRKAK